MPWVWAQSQNALQLFLPARGNQLTNHCILHSWTEGGSVAAMNSGDLSALRGTINGDSAASGPLVDDEAELHVTLVSPDRTVADTTMADARNRQSQILVGDEILWAWHPVRVDVDRYRFKPDDDHWAVDQWGPRPE